MMTRRWDNYTLIDDKNILDFWEFSLNEPKGKELLFIYGIGFDPRMNLILRNIIEKNSSANINVHAIEFIENDNSPSHEYKGLVDENINEFKNLVDINRRRVHKIDMWVGRGYDKHRVSSLNALHLYDDYEDLKQYNDIIIDISSMPRSIYFPIIGKLLYLIDSHRETSINMFIGVSENPVLDSMIKGVGMDEDPNYIKGFEGGLELTSFHDKPLVWLPILGRKTEEYLQKVFTFLEEISEIAPIIPFPSRNPRRGDNIFLDYYSFLLDEINIEPQNIIYASEQNPFEVYRKIHSTIISYNKSLEILGGCRAALTAFSSKLISLGALLASYELKHINNIGVGVVNLESQGYKIQDNLDDYDENESEQFLLWITGDPY